MSNIEGLSRDALKARLINAEAATRRALRVADERTMQNTVLRQENERLRAFIWTLDGKTICIRDGDTFIDDGIIVATDIIGVKQTAEVEPHAYVPSTLHMGDCAVCGHLQGAKIHI